MPWSVEKEDDTHFHVKGNVGVFKVAKASLSPAAHEKMRLACGGEVKMAAGGETPSDDLAPLVKPEAQPAGPEIYSGMFATPQPATPEPQKVYHLSDIPGIANDAASFVGDKINSVLSPLAGGNKLDPNNSSEPWRQQVAQQETPTSDASATQTPQASPAQPSSGQAKGPDVQEPSAAQMDKLDIMPGSSERFDITGAANESAKAAEGVGLAQQQAAEQHANAIASQVDWQKQWLQSYQQHEAERNQATQQMLDDIKNERIDPNHFWADKSGFDRVRMSIGLILGGIGSGLTGQPNIAAQFIQQAINRDMEAQRANLQKKETLFGYFRQKLGDDRAAELMTHSVLSNVAAQEVESAAMRAGGGVQAQQALLLGKQLQQQGLQSQAQVNAIQADTDIKRQQLHMQQMMFNFQRDALRGNMTGGGAEPGREYMPSSSAPKFTGDIAKFINDDRETRVRFMDPSGKAWVTHAPNAKVRDDAQSELGEIHAVREDVAQLKMLAANAEKGLVPWSAVRAQWKTFQNHASQISTPALAGIHKMSDTELHVGQEDTGETLWKARLNHGAALDALSQITNNRYKEVLRGLGVDEKHINASGEAPQAAQAQAPRPKNVPQGYIHVTDGKNTGWIPPGQIPAGFRQVS